MRILAPSKVDEKRRSDEDALVHKIGRLQESVRNEEQTLNARCVTWSEGVMGLSIINSWSKPMGSRSLTI